MNGQGRLMPFPCILLVHILKIEDFFVGHRVRVVKEEDLKSSAFARVGSSPTDVAFLVICQVLVLKHHNLGYDIIFDHTNFLGLFFMT